jgi:hypothetical protein
MVADQQALRAATATAVPHEVICIRSTGPTRPTGSSGAGRSPAARSPAGRPPAARSPAAQSSSTGVTITPVPSTEPP